MKKLLIVVMACYGLNAGAQVRQSENFIYLFSDSVIYARNIRLRPDFFNSLQLRADSRRIPLEQVKFFNNENGFFANTRRLNFGRDTEFAERIVDGRINIFQLRSYDPLLDDRGYRDGRRRHEAISIEMYYNKGYADLKKVSYTNLKMEMAGNRQAMDLLEGYRRSIRTSRALYIAAGASLVGSLVSFLVAGNTNNDQFFSNNGFGTQNSKSNIKNPNFTASFTLLGIGAGLAIGGYTTSVSGLRRLEQAVDVYNR